MRFGPKSPYPRCSRGAKWCLAAWSGASRHEVAMDAEVPLRRAPPLPLRPVAMFEQMFEHGTVSTVTVQALPSGPPTSLDQDERVGAPTLPMLDALAGVLPGG